MDEAAGTTSVHDIPEQEGLLFACLLDGAGGARLIGWDDVEQWTPEQGALWAHFDRSAPRVQAWLRQASDLTPVTSDAILAEETRPRVFRGRKGVVTILRGVNMNPGAEPKDLVAMRLWSDGTRVLSIRHHRLVTPRDVLRQLIEQTAGPTTAGELYERLISRITERMAVVVGSFDERLDAIEENIESTDFEDARRELSELRSDAVALRRYMAPQREALGDLLMDTPAWFDERARMNLREASDRLQRYVEELDAARERALVLKDDIANRLSETLNHNMYVLSIIAAIFLPLGFATGLLGINVGGMPGIESPYAFWITAAAMAAIVVVELIIFRKLKWL